MTKRMPTILEDDARAILEAHVDLGERKAVSYLPINTIEKVIGLKIEDYRSLIESRGYRCVIFSEDNCCTKSGAVFAYSCSDLRAILTSYSIVLLKYGWPLSPSSFIRRIASEWLDEDNPVLPVIRRAFGDDQSEQDAGSRNGG